ncbi:MAG: VCBS repeat-containing protein [Nitrospirae bacterium]|nr:VCBS repeat-containing protein [Nitrospirota bacterium]
MREITISNLLIVDTNTFRTSKLLLVIFIFIFITFINGTGYSSTGDMSSNDPGASTTNFNIAKPENTPEDLQKEAIRSSSEIKELPDSTATGKDVIPASSTEDNKIKNEDAKNKKASDTKDTGDIKDKKPESLLAQIPPPDPLDQTNNTVSGFSLKPIEISPAGNYGAAVTSIPIIVPPGRKGVQPNISLNYSSSAGNGWLGVGWVLDMGSIQRSTKKGLDYYNTDNNDDNDYIAMGNGSTFELVSRAGNWGAGFYGAKIEGAFAKYQKISDTAGWIVTTKDGTKYYYGESESSRQDSYDANNQYRVFKWCLDRVEDTNGNYMTITYGKNQGEVYLDKIEYTGNSKTGLTPSNYVKFYLETRTDTPPMYTTNASVITASRLKTIDIFTGGQYPGGNRARKYELEYDADLNAPGLQYSYNTKRSILGRITQYGSDGSTSLPEITFSFSGGSKGFINQFNGPAWSDDAGWVKAQNYATIQYPDLNGDGKADICARDSNGIVCKISTGSGFTSSFRGPDWSDDNDNWANPVYTTVGFITTISIDRSYYSTIQYPDLNGDGKADICSRSTTGIECWIGTDTGFINQFNGPAWSDDANWDQSASYYGTIQYPDLNGDGKADICARDSSGIICYLGTGSGFISSFRGPTWSNGSGWTDRSNYATIQYPDLNGDGKADICARDDNGIICKIGTGSGFTGSFRGPDWSDAGLWNQPEHYSTIRYPDLNGDGKADICVKDGYQITCLLGTGSGFADQFIGPPWSDAADWDDPNKYSTIQYPDLNGDGKADLCARDNGGIVCYLGTGKGFNNYFAGPAWSDNDPEHYLTIRYPDLNGDGKADICTRNDNGIICEKTTNDGVESLRSVDNGIGGYTTLSYLPSSVYDNIKLPFIVQTLSSVMTNDGNGNTSSTTYDYEGGYFDYDEREYRGFEKLTSRVNYTLPNSTATYTQTETWYWQDKIFNGRIDKQTTTDATGKIYAKVFNVYESVQPYPNTEFPRLKTKINEVYDGTGTPLRVSGDTYYDDYGNIVRNHNNGDESVTGDERDEFIEYEYDQTNWILSLPKRTYVLDSSGTQKAVEWYTYDPVTKNILKKETWLDTGPNPVITYENYDSYGNARRIIDPKGNQTNITFDTATNTYPRTITNALGQPAEKTYDYGLGKVIWEKDPNGNITTYKYDKLGRIEKVYGPLDPEATGIPTMQYVYPLLTDYGQVGDQRVTVFALEEHGTTNYIWSETFFDGLGRTIMTRSEAAPIGSVNRGIVISTRYNDRGLSDRQSLPYFQNTATGVDLETPRYTYNEYDPIGRIIKTTYPDNTSTRTGYLKGTAAYVDANGHQRVEIKDVYGRLIEVREYTGTDSNNTPFSSSFKLYATTIYGYDILGNLEYVRDAAGNETAMFYDSLSRKTGMYDPDMGYWEYGYDRNGNLISQLDAKDQLLTFQYDSLNRIKKKLYPNGTSINYQYDQYDNGSTNQVIGRLAKLTDASGTTTTTFYYDELGHTRSTEKIIDSIMYPTDKTYDALGRTKTLTYPDPAHTVVQYTYDSGGNLQKVQGGAVYAEYNNYNAFGQIGKIIFSNGITTEYSYYDQVNETNRLKTIKTYVTNNPATKYMDLRYDYDYGINIKQITDYLDPNRTRKYAYDDLNRLIEADSVMYGGKLIYQYDKIGNMIYNCKYGFYTYEDVYHVHAVTKIRKPDGTIVDQYSYDANGNMVSGAGRTFTYDYDNRPTSIVLNNNAVISVYDAGGQRIKKTAITGGVQKTTTYIGNIFECTDGICTKYIFAGSQRIAKIDNTGNHFYHTDHLGSSTVITNQSGGSEEQVFYYPYGESINTGSNIARHKFTGQEWDAETGLYYYGARYYDPKIARFTSADTIVPNFANPQSLNRYSYVYDNPVVISDADGHLPFLVVVAIGALIGGAVAAMTGGDIVQGMIMGAIGGIFMGAANAVVAAANLACNSLSSVATVALYASAGAAAGAVNAAIYGGDPGQAMLMGAVGGAAGAMVGGYVAGLQIDETLRTVLQIGGSGLVGGGVAELSGGDFGQGFMYAAIAAAASMAVNEFLENNTKTPGRDNMYEESTEMSFETNLSDNVGRQTGNEMLAANMLDLGDEPMMYRHGKDNPPTSPEEKKAALKIIQKAGEKAIKWAVPESKVVIPAGKILYKSSTYLSDLFKASGNLPPCQVGTMGCHPK